MSTIPKTFAFATDAESHNFTSGGKATGGYDGAQGNPTGSIYVNSAGRNNSDTSYFLWQGTWVDLLGIDSNSTVTNIQLTDLETYVNTYSTVTSATIGPLQLRNSSGVSQATLWSGRTPTGTDGSWQSAGSQTSQSVPAPLQPATTTIQLYYQVTITLGNDKAAQFDANIDNVDYLVTYNAPQNYQRSVTDTVGVTDSVSTVLGKATSIADSVGISDSVSAVVSASPITTYTIGTGWEQKTDAGYGYSRNGPVRDANGNLYIVLINSTTDSDIRVFKSTNGGETWTGQDTGNEPANGGANIGSIDVYPDVVNDRIWFATHDTTYVYFNNFIVSTDGSNPDTWDNVDVVVDGPFTNTGFQLEVGITKGDSDSDWLIVGATDITGTNEDSAYWYSTNSGSTWNGPTTLDDGNDSYDNLAIGCFYLNGYVYALWNRDDTGDAFIRRATNVDQTFSAHVDWCDFTHSTYNDMTKSVGYMSGSDEKICIVSILETTTYVRSVFITNYGTPDASSQIDSIEVYTPDAGSGPHAGVHELAVYGTTIYYVFADATDNDLYVISNADEAGWGDLTELWDGITCNGVSTGIFEYNNKIYLGAVVLDGTTMKFLRYYIAEATVPLTATLTDSVGITDALAFVLAYSRTISENEGITDTVATSRNIFKTLADSLGITDTLSTARNLFKTIADSLGITDTISRSLVKVASLSDTIGITDSLAWSIGRYLSIQDTIGITDTLTVARTLIKNIANTIGITDTISTARNIAKSLADSVGITDVLSAARKLTASLADTVGITDSISKSIVFLVSLSDTLGITDSLAVSLEKRLTIQNTIGISDSITTARALVLAFADNVGITDAITKSVGRIVSIADTVGITDAIDAVKGALLLYATISDTIGITDSLSTTLAKRLIFQNTVGISDSLVTAREIYKTIADSLGIADTITTARALKKALADNVGITDVLSRTILIVASIADSIGITDSLTVALAKAITFQNSVGITDTISIVRALVRTFAESIGITDSLQRAVAKVISFAETIGITDSIDALVNILVKYVTLSDTVGITDSLSKLRNLNRTISEAIGITDTISKAQDFKRSFLENVGITDTLTPARVIARTFSDSIGITDTITAAKLIAILLADNVGIIDTIAIIRTIAVEILDTLGITDALQTARNIRRNFSEIVSITDLLSTARQIRLAIQEAVSITDAVSKLKLLLVTIEDSVAVTDFISGSRLLQVLLQDSVLLTDVVTIVGVFIRHLVRGTRAIFGDPNGWRPTLESPDYDPNIPRE